MTPEVLGVDPNQSVPLPPVDDKVDGLLSSKAFVFIEAVNARQVAPEDISTSIRLTPSASGFMLPMTSA